MSRSARSTRSRAPSCRSGWSGRSTRSRGRCCSSRTTSRRRCLSAGACLCSQPVPTVLLAPILAILLGYGIEPKLVVVAIVCFFPIVVNAVDGLRSTDPELVRMMRTLYGTRLSIFRRVELPGALPAIFSGARVAATYAAVGPVFGEWAGSSSGLGFVILQAQPALETARIFAAVLVLSALALALYALVA